NGTVHDGDLKNLKIIRSDGTVLTNALDTTKGQYATFVFNPPFIVKQGDKVTLTVIADIIGGAKNNIQIQFEESSDVFAVGSLYGYGVNGQLYGAQINITTSATPTTVTVDAGQFSISINGPAQMTYTRDQTDAVLANVDFTAGTEKIDIRHIYIAVQGNTSTGGTLDSNNTSSYNEIKEVLQNVSLKDQTTGRSINGVRLTGSSDSGQATNGTSSATTTGTFQIYRFDDFTITGASHYQLDVDFIDNNSGNSPKSGDQYKIQICGEPQQLSTGANTVGCTFGGLIAISKTYQMQVEGLTTGDSVTDVRPRGTISGNAQRIATANLTVAVKGIGSVDTAVKNAKNVNLFRFEARAGEAKDILFTKAIVVAGVVANGVGAASQAGSINGSGSLVNGQNYSLWVDTDSNGIVDTIVDKGETAQSNKVTFGRLTGGGFVIPKQKTVVFEIHSDISASLTNNWLQIGFSTGDTYIEAEDVVRGSSLSGIKTDASNCTGTCDTTVTTTASKAYKLVSQGDLYVTVDTVPVKNRQLLGGVLGDSVFRLLMHAENEGIDVTDLQFTSSGGTATSVDHLELYFDGQTTPFTTATIGGCGNDAARKYYGTGATNVNTNYSGTASAFCAKMQEHELVVPKGADVKVLVKPWLKTDVNGATPNQSIQFFLDATRASNNATGSGAVRARGVDSSNNLSANDGNSTNNGEVFIGTATAASTNTLIRGLRSVSVLSKIQAITNAGPDTSVVPTGVSDLGQFKISAVTHANSQNGLNKVTLSGVIFNVTATNITLDYTAFLFYNKANSTVTSACTALNTSGTPLLQNASGSFLVDCPRLTASAVNTTIDPGTDGTIVLRGTVVNPKIASTNSTMQVSLQSFDSISRTTFSPTTSHFEWTDKDNGTATTATFQWVEYSDTTVKSTNFQG
ncbi:hypothetical protein HY285_03005, partial [Candidatus Peregrinibacteria bacterium]|nr:hypothetical protein [Candidatus Peregrinibacteria bacterium]